MDSTKTRRSISRSRSDNNTDLIKKLRDKLERDITNMDVKIPNRIKKQILSHIDKAVNDGDSLDVIKKRIDKGNSNLFKARMHYKKKQRKQCNQSLETIQEEGSDIESDVGSVGETPTSTPTRSRSNSQDGYGSEIDPRAIFEYDKKNERTVLPFSRWIERFKVKRGEPWNYIKGFENQPRTKYFIDKKNSQQFWKKWCTAVDNKPGSVSIQENLGDYVRVVADIDFRINNSNSVRLFKRHHCRSLVKAYISVLNDLCVGIRDDQLYCLLLVKERPVYNEEKQIWKDGIHLAFPHIIIPKWANKILQVKADALVQHSGIFNDLPYDEAEVDKVILSNSQWYLYGSSKRTTDSQSYQIKYIYDHNLGDVTLSEVFPSKPKGGKREYWMPYMLRNEGCVPNVVLKDGVELLVKKRQRRQRDEILLSAEQIKQNVDIAKNLLKMFSNSRADKYAEWLRIGMMLSDVTGGSEEGLELWDDFSKKSNNKYEVGACGNKWDSFKLGDSTLRNFEYMAMKDSPGKFYAYTRERYKDDMQTAYLEHAGGTPGGVAKVIKALYGGEFVCAGAKNNEWYQFRGHRWVKLDDASELFSRISINLKYDYQVILQRLRYEQTTTMDPGEKFKLKSHIDSLTKLVSQKLNTPAFIDGVIRYAAKAFMRIEGFEQKLDTNPYILGFSNGILVTGPTVDDIEFRHGCPEDYVSMSTGVTFPNKKPSKRKMGELIDFLSKVFVDKSLRAYNCRFLASMYIGGNTDKTVQIWIGDTNNAKSTLQNLIELALGDYAKTVPLTTFTGKQVGSESCTPGIFRLRGARIIFANEATRKDPLNASVVKNLSGNDKLYYRKLYGNGDEYMPLFKIIMSCNKLPPVDSEDPGLWTRLHSSPFETTFVPEIDAPKTIKKQWKEKKFPIIMDFSKLLVGMRDAFNWYMVNVWLREYYGNGLAPPPKVMAATERYRSMFDYYASFIRFKIDEYGDSDDVMSLDDIYDLFVHWYKRYYISDAKKYTPNLTDVEEYLLKKWGSPSYINGYPSWKGKREKVIIHEVKVKETNNNDSDEEPA